MRFTLLLFFLSFINAQIALPTFQAVHTPHTAEAESGSQTFSYTGGIQTLTILSGVNTITIKAWGAQGGGDGSNYWGTGGKGGYSIGDASVSPGETIYIVVGQQGFQSSSSTAYNGGGEGNPGSYGEGWTGGGATHVAKVSGVLSTLSGNVSDILIVAGGGGGNAGSTRSSWDRYKVDGGAGGGSSGIDGPDSDNNSSYRPGGTGGTQSAGGTTQSASVEASFGLGASSSNSNSDGIQGGGGGGGYYGGGAGAYAGGGGGGGSGYIGGVTNSPETIAGNATMPDPDGDTMTGREGNGLVVISWE
jgi:hypothetical protein